MIRKIFVLAFACVFALLGLTACSTPSSTPSNPKAYKVVEEYQKEVWTYACEAGYIPVDVAIGDMTQRDGSSYSLKENKDAAGEHVSVTLIINLVDN